MRNILFSLAAVGVLSAVMYSNADAAVIHSPGFDPNDATDAQHIALAAQPQFQAGGWFTYTSGGLTTYASATLVSPQWVVTAAHNVISTTYVGNDVTMTPLLLSGMRLGFGAGPLSNATQYSVTQIIRPPGYDPNNSFADIAFLKLNAPITTITPMPLFTGKLSTGQPTTAIGYGQPGSPAAGLLPFDGVERGMVNDILPNNFLLANFPDAKNLVMTELWPNNDDGYYQSYGGNATAGDDGGGLMVFDNGVWKLAGVNAFELGSPDYASVSLYTDVSSYVPFISSQAALASLVPEPATITLFAAGALALLKRSRTKWIR